MLALLPRSNRLRPARPVTIIPQMIMAAR
jgi:hypothetical protein